MKISKKNVIAILCVFVIISLLWTTFLLGYKQGVSSNGGIGAVIKESGDGSGLASKPKVELFVMAYCPYGTQIEKGIVPVVETLGNKIDFKVKFVNYAMHGEDEIIEQLNQYCIQEEYPEKFLEYLKCFLEAGDSQGCMNRLGITENSLKDCKEKTDAEFKITELFNDPTKSQWKGKYPPFNIHDKENKKYGVGGSPTLVIDGEIVSSNRDAASLLKAICNKFSTKPKECSTDLSAHGSPSPGFGFEASGAAAVDAGCGA